MVGAIVGVPHGLYARISNTITVADKINATFIFTFDVQARRRTQPTVPVSAAAHILSAAIFMSQPFDHRGDGFRKHLGIAAVVMRDVDSVSL